MNADKKKQHLLCDKVKSCLDGRKQRWLAEHLGITDTAMSNRINGVYPFKNQEIQKMSEIFSDQTFLDYIL